MRYSQEMMVRIGKILRTLQHEVYRRQVEETMDTPVEESGGFHGSYLDRASFRPPTE